MLRNARSQEVRSSSEDPRMEDPRTWIAGDESAGAMLARVPTVRPFLLPPPLHRVPLRAGNVVEIVGSSPSAKSEVLLQAAINCILPKEWKGIHFGGMEQTVMYFDLDCRFDVLRLSQVLKHRIVAGSEDLNGSDKNNVVVGQISQISKLDNELFLTCMRRFLYIRCYSSLEFLAALKTMPGRAQGESKALGVGIHLLMMDSIGAFYWTDRACNPLPVGDNRRKTLTLQNIFEVIVEEIRKLLQVQPVLVLATKATIFGGGLSTNISRRAFGKRSADDVEDSRHSNAEAEKLLYHEYMPSIWQSFVTHRIYLQASDGVVANMCGSFPVYASKWLQPALHTMDRFSVRDDGVFMVSCYNQNDSGWKHKELENQ